MQGNSIVDCLAREAAKTARIPQADRFRVQSIERKARLVRRRLLRVGLDFIQASQSQSEGDAAPAGPPPLPPPAPIVCARFATSHVLTESGRSRSVCKGSAYKATLSEWLKSASNSAMCLIGCPEFPMTEFYI